MKTIAIVLSTIGFLNVSYAQQENTTVSELKPSERRTINLEKEIETKKQPAALPSKETMPAQTKRRPSAIAKSGVSVEPMEGHGNLPQFAQRRDVNTLETQDNIIKVAKNIRKVSDLEIGRGDILSARISQDLIGYEEASSPVRAVITEGRYKGAWLIGNATMDKKTKNILVKFSVFRSQELETPIEATVHSVSGELGLKGEFVSNYWNYFWAEVLASGVSGYANALTERKRNILGYNEIVPTPQSAAHQAVASAAEKTSDRFAERAREAPEFTVVRGPTEVNVFITKGPTDL